jgi:hypothetical protein
LSSIPKAIRKRVFDRDGGRCRYCRLAQIGQAAVFHVNHVIPRSKGGRTAEDNLVLQCPHCSLRKADKMLVKDPTSGAEFMLFHPLTQEWDDHIALDAAGVLHEKTATGRATIAALRMNDPLPRVARLVQIRLEWLAPSDG